jgi:transcriptional regulator with XRE-family HTH domain
MRGAESPHPIDIIAGRNLQYLRKRAGVSQSQLGNAVGITFQQVQKYERGKNRMSMSRVYEFAKVLRVNPADFFAGIDADWPPSLAGSKQFDHWLGLFVRAQNLKMEKEVIRCVDDIIDLVNVARSRPSSAELETVS